MAINVSSCFSSVLIRSFIYSDYTQVVWIHKEPEAHYTEYMPSKYYEELEHTADWALHVWGANFEELLRNAAAGMQHLAGIEPSLEDGVTRVFELEAQDREQMLVRWLEELLFHIEARHAAFSVQVIEVTGDRRLVASVVETPASPPKKAIKAVTYHNLRVEDTPRGVEATIVFDV